MARVKVSGLDRIIDKIDEAFRSTIKAEQLLVDISKFSIERIRSRARLGRRMIENGGEVILPKLSNSYQKWRSNLVPGQSTGIRGGPITPTDAQFFRPGITNSNLTFSGQLLKSLNGKILKRGPDKAKIELAFTGQRSDIEKDGKSVTKSNASVYTELVERNEDYAILSLDKKAIERIQSLCLTRLRQELKRLKLK